MKTNLITNRWLFHAARLFIRRANYPVAMRTNKVGYRNALCRVTTINRIYLIADTWTRVCINGMETDGEHG